jgi:IS30 family transposase
MKQRTRIYYSAEQRADIWDRWQRGSNENTNRLLRQYFPKGTDLSIYTQAQLNKVARQLNERPRKTLEYETPAGKFQTCVATTG